MAQIRNFGLHDSFPFRGQFFLGLDIERVSRLRIARGFQASPKFLATQPPHIGMY
jgi:hypothetical protein